MPLRSWLARALPAALIALAAYQGAAAQDVATFYRGKTIRLAIGAPAASDDDIYARLLAKYLGRHLAGGPAIAASNVPGRGGAVAAGMLYAEAAQDGTVIGAVPAESITAPLWAGAGTVRYHPAQFVFLGSAASESTNCFVLAEGPVRSLRDAIVREVSMGALADGGPTRDGPVLLNAVLGTKFRVVANYAGVGDILDAIARGQVAGACGLTRSSISTRHPDWLLRGVLQGLVQESVSGSALAARLGIPLAADFVASAPDREVLALAYAQQAFGRPYFVSPESPPERTAALRKAFIDSLRDPDFLAEARRASLEIDPISGEAVQALVAKLYATPAEAIERLRTALAQKPAR